MGFIPKKWVPKEIKKYVPKEILIPDEPEVPQVPDIPVETEDALDPVAVAESQAQASDIQKKIERRKRGRRSTILTSGLGVTDEATVKRPTILGTV